ncbi:MAG: hypothetical protein SWX82_20905 [Cyanobacteriota bacterium]|nr:hypothetical protein [Cyanobacteriota bacterium]
MNDNLPKSSPESEEVEPSVLKIRGKTLICKNTIFQISNISSISLIEIKKTKKRTKIYSALLFTGVVLLVSIGIILLSYPDINVQIFGLLMIVIDILVLPRLNIINPTSIEYGMVIQGNSGEKKN